jgi:hypothetical protein
MDNRSSNILYVPNRKTFVSKNNVVFGNKCPIAKDSPNVNEDASGDVIFDFPPEAHVLEINSSNVDGILDQTETHYILLTTNKSE